MATAHQAELEVMELLPHHFWEFCKVFLAGSLHVPAKTLVFFAGLPPLVAYPQKQGHA